MSPRWGLGTLGVGVLAVPSPALLSPHRKMQHKNLVRLLGVILHQGLYIVMEHVSKVRWGEMQVGVQVGLGEAAKKPRTRAPCLPSRPARATW